MRFLSLFLLLLPLTNALSVLTEGEFVFAVPSTGRITLGVFDKNGHLVRTLHALDGEETFQVGLNGFISRWNGLDDSGKKVPPGTYHIRGYQIGEATVTGEAFHFNDWISESDTPPISWIEDFEVLDDGDILLFAKTPASTVMARASIKDGLLAIEKNPPANKSSPARQKLAELTSRSPETFLSIDSLGETLLATDSQGVWFSQNGSAPLQIELPSKVDALSLGPDDTFWFIGSSGEADQPPMVGQADFSGEILRALPYEADEPVPKKIRAAKSGSGFVVLEELSGSQRLRSLTRDESGEWVVDWEKTIRKSSRFGFANGEVTADAGDEPQLESLRFRLEENPLTGERQTITIRALADAQGSRLATEDGLPLLLISNQPDIWRTVIHRGKAPDSLRFLQGNGAAVEEYLIEGLRHILPLNAGQIEIR
ncbi:MAG: hypothetical protein NTW41_00175 [Verrucomicrobia bacterium]|nr:hypothetical protein [Verrucomicrobiota bacterium]